MSFFDEDDEPTRRAPRPRRAATAGDGLGVDQQTLWVRRGIAAVLGLLILVLLVVAINACQDSRRKSALRDYNNRANALVAQSDDEVGTQFFQTMADAAQQSPPDLQTQISSLRVQSETILEQAEKLDTPSQATTAQQSLLIALEQRRDGLDYIAKEISTALGNEGDVADQAIENIAGQMQAFLASDVLIQSRVTPVVKEALKDNDVVSDPVATKGFLPGFSWLQPAYIADQLGTRLSDGGQNRDPDEPPAPGLHGNGLVSTTVGGVTLQPGGVANRVGINEDLTFHVKFANQGENDEFDVKVSVTLQGQGKPIKASKTQDTIAAGDEAEVNLALPKKPNAGEVYEVTAEVKPVPGEKKTDNNKSVYNVLFQ